MSLLNLLKEIIGEMLLRLIDGQFQVVIEQKIDERSDVRGSQGRFIEKLFENVFEGQGEIQIDLIEQFLDDLFRRDRKTAVRRQSR